MSWSFSIYDRSDESDHVGVERDVDGVCPATEGECFDVLAVWSLGVVGDAVELVC